MIYNIVQVKHEKNHINVLFIKQFIHVLWTSNYQTNMTLEVQVKQLPLKIGSKSQRNDTSIISMMVKGHYVNIISGDKNMNERLIENEKARPLVVYKV